jgi:hypothetical protein
MAVWIWRMLVVEAGMGRKVAVAGRMWVDRLLLELRELVTECVERVNVDVRFERTFIVRDLVNEQLGGGPG